MTENINPDMAGIESIEVQLNLSIYQPSFSNERMNKQTNKYTEYTYFTIIFCSFVFYLIQNIINKM